MELKIDQKRKLLVEVEVEKPAGWITVPVVFLSSSYNRPCRRQQ